jgi:hypothetical protein
LTTLEDEMRTRRIDPTFCSTRRIDTVLETTSRSSDLAALSS